MVHTAGMQTSRTWIEFRLTLPAEAVEATESLLFRTGAQSVSLEEGGSEAGMETQPGEANPWRRVQLSALFESTWSPSRLLQALRGRLAPGILATASFETLADQDWSRAWMRRWKPQRFGQRLWICPTWEVPPDANAVNLRLDPGGAFGTGSHATTALCLEWLEAGDLQGRSVLDYGCGSGVLAMAALLLGARQAWACDLDRQALRVAAENAERNGVARLLWIGHPAQLPSVRADVLVANISSRTLAELAPELTSLQDAGGRLVLSGILESQVPEVWEAYEAHYDLRLAESREGWVLLEGTKRRARATRNASTPRDRAAPP